MFCFIKYDAFLAMLTVWFQGWVCPSVHHWNISATAGNFEHESCRLWWSPAFFLPPPACWLFWLLLNYLNNYCMNCNQIWFRCAWCPEDEPKWHWWFAAFSSSATSKSKFSLMLWNIFTSTGWIYTNVCADLRGSKRMIWWIWWFPNVSSSTITNVNHVWFGVKCLDKILDRFPWNLS